MKSKKIVWAFSGAGKTYAAEATKNGKSIVDADCKLFQYKDVPRGTLHQQNQVSRERDESYPDNYIKYVKEVDADIIMVNCHPSLLKNFDDIVMVYPNTDLEREYLERYKERGDNASYIDYMQTEFKGMIDFLDTLDFPKVKIKEEKTYLTELITRGVTKVMFMTKKELAAHLQTGYDLKNSEIYQNLNLDQLNQYFTKEYANMTEMAQDIFDGKVKLNMEQYMIDTRSTQEILKKERVAAERRMGLSHSELSDKIMQGIVNGALGIRYAEISPYAHGYEVTFGGEGPTGSTRDFTNRWECYCDFFDVSDKVATFIEEGRQNNEVFGKRCEPLDLANMLKTIEAKESERITEFTPAAETNFVRRSRYGLGHVASVMDVHAGKGLDGIAKHHYYGDYSTITPVNQNNLVETLVYLKGFCLDNLERLGYGPTGIQKVKDYLKSQGTDISTSEKLEQWIRNNPEKCCLEENRNRKRPLEAQMSSARQEIEPSKDPAEPAKEIEQERDE